jgi:hypothetical protein
MAEWIENKGNDCPVPHETRVEVKFDNGETSDTPSAGSWAWGRRIGDNDGTGGTITHYRIIE